MLAFVGSACSVILQGNATQCSTTDDCTNRGGAFAGSVCDLGVCRMPDAGAIIPDAGTDANEAGPAGPWSCLGSAKAPGPPVSPMSVTIRFSDPTTASGPNSADGLPIEGASVRSCPKLDVTCASPYFPPVVSGADGLAVVPLPANYDGYIEVSHPRTLPVILYFTPDPVRPLPYAAALFTPTQLAQLAYVSGSTIDSSLGHTLEFTQDCSYSYDKLAKGVSLAVDRQVATTKAFYVVDGLPSSTVTETDGAGIGGFTNLPPGVVTITASVPSVQKTTGTTSILIRAGAITYASIPPRR